MIRVCTLLVQVLLCAAGNAQDPILLRLHHPLPPVSPAHQTMLMPWAERINRQSDGRLRIKIYPSMQLGGAPPQLLNQVRDGVVDIVWTLTGYTPGRLASLEVFELPGMNLSLHAVNRAMVEFVDLYPEEFEHYKVLAVFAHAGQLLHSRVPIRSAEDIKGLKIRIPSRISGWMVEAMGAIPIGTPVTKIPELLSKGIVDAALIPFEVVGALRVDELVDYHISLDLPGSDRFHTQTFVIAMNPESFLALPPALQAVIERNAGMHIADWLADTWLANEKPGIALAEASGEVIRLPRDESQLFSTQLQAAVLARWLKAAAERGQDGEAVLADAQRLLAEHSR